MISNLCKILLVICLGICVQVLFMFTLMDPHELEWPDSVHNYLIAKSLLNGSSFWDNPDNLIRSPGYPYFLFLLMNVIGDKILSLRIAHVVLSVVMLLGVYLVGMEWKGGRFGRIMMVVSALYPFFILIPLTFYPEALLICLTPWVIYFLMRMEHSYSIGKLFITAVLISSCVMIRPTFIALGLAYSMYTVLCKLDLKRKVLVISMCFVFPCILLTTWTLKNYSVYHHFDFAMGAGANFYKGFSEENDVGNKIRMGVPEKAKKLGIEPSDLFKMDSFYKHEAFEYIKAHPFRSIGKMMYRMLDIWNPIPNTSTNYPIWKKVLSAIPYSTILVFAIVGFYLNRKDRFAWMLVGILFLNTLVNGFFAVSVRYRVILDVVLIAFAVEALFRTLFYIQMNVSNQKTSMSPLI